MTTIHKVQAKIYKGKYLATEDGKIFSIVGKNKLHVKQQKSRVHSHGYLRVNINRKDEYVHRIVAFCFCENPNNYVEVNHIDGNKKNNNTHNLEWCTRHKNNLHAFQTGLRSYEELRAMARMPKIGNRKFSPLQIREIRKLLKNKKSYCEIARKFSCSHNTISAIDKLKCYTEEMYK